MNLVKKFRDWRKRISDPLYGIDDWEKDENWDQVVFDRKDLRIGDKDSRETYVRGCLEQIAEAAREMESLQIEYDNVTSHLKDMEEIEALPQDEMELVAGYAKSIDNLKDQQKGYLQRTNRMPDALYNKLSRMEDELAEGYNKLKETEDYQTLVKKDLKRLENEKQAFFVQKTDLRNTVEDCKGMSIVCAVAVAVCVVILLFLQYFFDMNTQIGYLIAMLAGAIGITLIFIKHSDSKKELKSVERGITRLIQLQNTVKIRYVNNTNLLDYLYVKYQVQSAGEFGKNYEQYLEEKAERESYREAEMALGECESRLLHELRRYQVKDPMIWLHQTEALLDKREMVEIRHKLIIQRQSLRRRMDYNREVVALNAKNEIRDLVNKYPKYANEILAIVSEYEENYS